MIRKSLYILTAVSLFFSCAINVQQENENEILVDINTIKASIEELSSDEFLGRKPFTEGENKTVN